MPAVSRSQVSAVMPSLAQQVLLHLLRRRLGQLGHDAHVARHHEVRHARHQELDQLGRIDRSRRRPATPPPAPRPRRTRWARRRRRPPCTGGMGADLGLDLEGGDVLAAPADRVLHAVDEEDSCRPRRRGRRRRCGTSRCARRAPWPRGSCSSRGSSPTGRSVRTISSPTAPGATSQSFSSTMRDLDAVARPAAGAERRRDCARDSGDDISVMLKTV